MTYIFDFHNPLGDSRPTTIILSARPCADSAIARYGAARESGDNRAAWQAWPAACREMQWIALCAEEIGR